MRTPGRKRQKERDSRRYTGRERQKERARKREINKKREWHTPQNILGVQFC